jgi:hypothetical protein
LRQTSYFCHTQRLVNHRAESARNPRYLTSRCVVQWGRAHREQGRQGLIGVSAGPDLQFGSDGVVLSGLSALSSTPEGTCDNSNRLVGGSARLVVCVERASLPACVSFCRSETERINGINSTRPSKSRLRSDAWAKEVIQRIERVAMDASPNIDYITVRACQAIEISTGMKKRLERKRERLTPSSPLRPERCRRWR